MQYIGFNPAEQAIEVLAFPTTTAEQDVAIVTDLRHLQKSQFSAYWDISFGTHTSFKVRYYFTTGKLSSGQPIWYQVPAKNVSTGVISDIPTVVDSTSPVNNSKTRFVEDFGVSGATGFKVTVQGVGGTSGTVNTLTVMMRDN